MDDHDEVVREPFDEVEHSPVAKSTQLLASDQRQIPAQAAKMLPTDRDISEEAKEILDGQMNPSAISKGEQEATCNVKHGLTSEYEDPDEDLPSAEDADFAETFGIKLKHKSDPPTPSQTKSLTGVDRLINSEINSKQESSKAPKPLIKTSITSDCVYHRGTFYQKGDIVGAYDQEDGLVYFAQLTGFLQDQYCEKSASLNWLVPTKPTSRTIFDPVAYRLGLEDPQLRKLDCLTLVCHCPHDYYLRKFFQDDAASSSDQSVTNQSELRENPRLSMRNQQAFIWTSMSPCKVPRIGAK